MASAVPGLERWCRQQLGSLQPLQALPGDAGFRRYFRLGDSDLLAVHAPPEQIDIAEWLGVGELFAAAGVRVPAVTAVDSRRGFLLIEDFGEQLLNDRLTPKNADALYRKALQTLLRIQGCKPLTGGWRLSDYSAVQLQQELELFPCWFVERLLGVSLSATARQLLDRLFAQLVAEAGCCAAVAVHRDYHSRNLLVLPSGELGVVDFQDARLGTPAYDLVSLFKDCYIHWPRQQILQWLGDWYAAAEQRQLLPAEWDLGVFVRHFDLVGLQRHLKVLGIFSRLQLRDGKPRYLNDLPLVIDYVRECCGLYPELHEFGDWFQSALDAAIAVQPWSRQQVSG